MARINLRDYYPFYTVDLFVDIPDEVAAALAEPGTDLRIFAKPEVHGHRRMAVALAVGESEADARAKAGLVADALTLTVE